MERTAFSRLASCLVILALLLSGCAPTAAPAPPPKAETRVAESKEPVAPPKLATPTATSKPAEPQPRYGGTLAIANQADPTDFDVQAAASIVVLGPIGPAYSGLVQYDPLEPGKIVADLAESWEESPDGKTYTFHLRKGVKWHDGKPFTATDAEFSVNRLMAKSSNYDYVLKPIVQTVQAVDDTTLKLTLKSPQPSLMKYLGMSWGVMMPKNVVEARGNMKTEVVGTGAYKFKKYSPGASLELVKKPDYFVKGQPHLDGIIFYPIKDEATRFAAFKTHRVSVLAPLGLTTFQAQGLKKDEPQAALQEFNQYWWAFHPLVEKAPWNDARVRRAVSLALDRQQALKVLEFGMGRVASFVPSELGGLPEQELLKTPGFRQPKDADLAEAKKLLTEAGYPQGFKTSMVLRLGREYESAAVFVKDQLAKVGVSVQLDVRETAGFFEAKERYTFELLENRNIIKVPDADNMLSQYYYSGAINNYGKFSDRKLDELIDKNRGTLDAKERARLVSEIEQLLNELTPSIVLYYGSYWMAFWKSEVANLVPPVSVYNGLKYSQVWLTK